MSSETMYKRLEQARRMLERATSDSDRQAALHWIVIWEEKLKCEAVRSTLEAQQAP